MLIQHIQEIFASVTFFHILEQGLGAGLPRWGITININLKMPSLVSSPHAPPGEKQSGERSRISLVYYPKVVKTNEIARSVIITYHFPCNSKICSSHLSIHTFFERVVRKMFWTLLGYTVTEVRASPRNSTWFTRPFLLVRGWGLGTRLENARSYRSLASFPGSPGTRICIAWRAWYLLYVSMT